MICPVCESQVRDGAAFCPQCGTRLDDQSPLQMPANAPRPSVPPTAPQAQDTSYQYPTAQYPGGAALQPPAQARQGRSLTPVLVGIASALVVIIIALAVVLLRRGGSGIPIDEKHFPDAQFRAWLSENADEDGDGIITEVEASKVIVIRADKVASVKGVEYFPMVEELHFTDSDLVEVEIPDFDHLEVVDFSGSEQLENVTIEKAPKLREVDLTDTIVKRVVLPKDNDVSVIKIPDTAEIVNPPSGGTNDPGTVEKSITWMVPVYYRSTIQFEGKSPMVTTSTATYDDNGRLVHMEHVNPNEMGDGDYTESADYSYDDQGRLVHVDVTYSSFSTSWDLTYTDTSCHAALTDQSSGTDRNMYIDYTFDDQGRTIACAYETLGANGYMVGNVSVSYDDEGKITRVSGTEADGYSTVDITVEYHDNGRVSRIVSSDSYSSQTYLFDEQGRVTSYSVGGYESYTDTYGYGDGPLPTSIDHALGGSLSSTSDTIEASITSNYYSRSYEMRYTTITTDVQTVPIFGIGPIDYTFPEQYGDPWIHATSRPFGTRQILQANELWLAQHGDTPAASEEPSEPEQATYQSGLADDGTYVLVGTVDIHKGTENLSDLTVVSITLDEPVDYTYTYKHGPEEATANKVELSNSNQPDYDMWAAYEGQHIVVGCESLQLAYHDGSYHLVDSFSVDPWLISN